MATKKKPAQEIIEQSKSDNVSFFLKPKTGGSDSTQINARVPLSVYNEFKKAQKIAEKNGMELSLTDVIIFAMKYATEEVTKKYPELDLGEGE